MAAFTASMGCATELFAEQAALRSRGGLREPLYRVAETAASGTASSSNSVSSSSTNPLLPAIRVAHRSLEKIDRTIFDYSCTLVKRERIDEKLGSYEFIYTKIRHKPFSVYMYFLSPEASKGQEALYVQGQNDNKLLGNAGSGLRARFGTVSLAPDGLMAMSGQRYPITEVGIRNLTARLIARAKQGLQFNQCEVLYFKNTRIGKGASARTCTCIQVTHLKPQPALPFHRARIFIDDELNIPIRYEAHDFPKTPGGKPVLLEEYTYLNLKINPGFTNVDFDSKNPNYNF